MFYKFEMLVSIKPPLSIMASSEESSDNQMIIEDLSVTKQLRLIIQPKVIDHLGIKMYQKPVDVIAEFIANAWDADSEIAKISINEDRITITDHGTGMTFDECQKHFLTVGRDRRKEAGSELTEIKSRPLLGRKGIGKFAGFGVAQKVTITTISKKNGELTSFEMDIADILSHDSLEKAEKPITVIDFQPENSERKLSHGTTVTLHGVGKSQIDEVLFKSELSRRFLLTQIADDFSILINNEPLPESFSTELEFVFPRDLTESEKTKFTNLTAVDNSTGWGEELFLGKTIRWRIGFFEEPIETEELRGIAIFAKGKMAQKPFFFDITGGISGQHGLEYMTGQIMMDFIDEGANDLIATERQRINLQIEPGKQIKNWGIERIKLLASIWKERRSEKRLQELEDKLGQFKERLDALPSQERKTVKSVLLKIASFERLGKKRFQDWCSDILTSWEMGRLKELIIKISETRDIDEQALLEMLAEADVLTALNIAESVKTKILTIGELKSRVTAGQHENKVRDYIYEHPWLIHPRWERFQKERSVQNLLRDMGVEHLNGSPAFNGRVDLALSAGSQLMLVEFMRPGIELDRDHIHRIDDYVTDIRNRLSSETGNTIRSLDTAYLIADKKKDTALINSQCSSLAQKGILVMTWDTLIEEALKQWRDHLDLLKQRNPQDKRIQEL